MKVVVPANGTPFPYSCDGICTCLALSEGVVTLSLVLGSIWPAQGSQGGSGPSLQGRRAGLRQRNVRNGQSARSLLGPQLREQREGSRARGRGRPRPPQGRRAAPPSLSAAQDLTAGRAPPVRSVGGAGAAPCPARGPSQPCTVPCGSTSTPTRRTSPASSGPRTAACWRRGTPAWRCEGLSRVPDAPPAARALHAASAALTPVPAGSPCSPSPPACPAPARLPRPPRPLQSLSTPAPGDLAFLSS